MSKKSNRFSPEVRERAVRMVLEHRGEYPSLWATIESIAPKIGCVPQLAKRISIPGIDSVERDTFFDDDKMRSAGIRLSYSPRAAALAGVKDGILLELGFDDTAPNRPVTISSWALDFAIDRGEQVFDNRAVDVPCYAPTHTFVEKLQTISTKYRRLAEAKEFPANFLRHYYDVYCLLDLQEVQEFMKNPAYQERKEQRFRSGDELAIAKNPAFTLTDPEQRKLFAREQRPRHHAGACIAARRGGNGLCRLGLPGC